MTTTKVECREFGIDSRPHVEEVASYAYSVQEENLKPQNGVLIEEFSEGEEKKSNLNVNQGVTIVSVSDDESTLKALSRDVSTEDVADQLPEDQKTNGISDEFCFNGPEEEKTLENIKLHRMSKITETIAEERFSEEPLSAELSNQTLQEDSSTMKKVNLSSQGLVISNVNSAKKVVEKSIDRPDTAMELSQETAKLEEAETPTIPSVSLSRQSSQKAQLDDDAEIDDDMKDLLARVKRQRSVLDEILDKESGRESGTTAKFHDSFSN